MAKSNSEFKTSLKKAGEKFDTLAAKASEKIASGTKKAGKEMLKTGKQIGESFCYPKINDIVSDSVVRYNFILALKNNQIDPSSITIRDYNGLKKYISFSLNHVTNKYGRISSVPYYYTYYIKTKELVNEYERSIEIREADEEELRH